MQSKISSFVIQTILTKLFVKGLLTKSFYLNPKKPFIKSLGRKIS